MIQLRVSMAEYLLLTALLLAGSYTVFRVIVRRDYRQRGALGAISSTLQLVVFAAIFSYPYLFNPPEWVSFWELAGPTAGWLQAAGLAVILVGFLAAFGTMAWFGLARAFGLKVEGLIQGGPYRWSRNPQVVGGYLLVLGTGMQWPSWYACAWMALWGFATHWMILTEEEHLKNKFGEGYLDYCRKTPRYLWKI